MVKDGKILEAFNRDFIARSRLSHAQNIAIFDALWIEAVRLGVFPALDPLEGIEVDIRVASILNNLPFRHRRKSRTR